jgi:hypothetical protein
MGTYFKVLQTPLWAASGAVWSTLARSSIIKIAADGIKLTPARCDRLTQILVSLKTGEKAYIKFMGISRRKDAITKGDRSTGFME